MGPPTLQGKPVLPVTKEHFVVRVTNSEGHRVCLLFNWGNLYNVAFYVEDKQVETNRCWYFFGRVDKSILPPQEQFSYVDIMGQGLFLLPTNESYAGLGQMNIRLGKNAINGYVRKMFTIRASMTRSGRNQQKLVIGPALKLELTSGPLSFGPVAISEASRFADYKYFMLDNIYLDTEVPLRFSSFFTEWSILSRRVRDGQGFVLVIRTTGERYPLTAAQVVTKIAILCSSILHKDIDD